MISIPVGDSTISAIHDAPAAPMATRTVVAFAHGAGGNLQDRGVRASSKALTEQGIDVVRFNFLYSERKSGRPDPMPKLTPCIEAVADWIRGELVPGRLVIGGRSMGGRAASMLAAEGFEADGLVLLAYPLHPPGAPEKLRDAHLPRITMPALCCNGTRDTFCTPALMDEVMTRVGDNWTMHWVEGADHSFHVLKSSGRTDAQVMDEIGETARGWIEGIPAAR